MKILLHSNAPWSASGYGQQAAMFAQRARRDLPQGTSDWQRANDLLEAAGPQAKQQQRGR